MYNWKSCTLGGVEITSLRLNSDLVWEKLQISEVADLYYTIIPTNVILDDSDFDTLIEALSNISLDEYHPVIEDQIKETVEGSLLSDASGTLVVLTKSNNEPIFKIYDPTLSRFSDPITLTQGIPSVDEGFDIEPSIALNEDTYNIWTSLDTNLQSGTNFIIYNKK